MSNRFVIAAFILIAASCHGEADRVSSPLYLPDHVSFRYVFAQPPVPGLQDDPASISRLYEMLRAAVSGARFGDAANIRVRIASILYGESDGLSARATLSPAISYFASIRDLRALLRTLSLDQLSSTLINQLDESEKTQSVDLETTFHNLMPEAEVPSDLVPWCMLFDGYQLALGDNQIQAQAKLNEVLHSDSSNPITLALANLALADVQSPFPGDADAANSHISSAKRLFKIANLPTGLAQADLESSTIAFQGQHYTEALSSAENALRQFRRRGVWQGEVDAALKAAASRLYVGDKDKTFEFIDEAEATLLRHGPRSVISPSWKLSEVDVDHLVLAISKIPSLSRPRRGVTSVAEARSFLSWAHRTRNPFVEFAGLRVLAASLASEGQWVDSIRYLLEAEQLQQTVSAKTTLSEQMTYAAELDFDILRKQKVAFIASIQYPFSDICESLKVIGRTLSQSTGNEHGAESTPELVRHCQRIVSRSGDTDKHRLKAISDLKSEDLEGASREVHLLFKDLTMISAGLEKFKRQLSPADYPGPGDEDSVERARDGARSRPHDISKARMIYWEYLARSVILNDRTLSLVAAQKSLEALQDSTTVEEVRAPIVLGGFPTSGDSESTSSAGPRNWKGVASDRMESIYRRFYKPPWRSLVWGELTKNVAILNAVLTQATSETGQDAHGIVADNNRLVYGMNGIQLAMQLAGRRDFIPLSRLSALDVRRLFQRGGPQVKWARAMAKSTVGTWLMSSANLPITKPLRQKGIDAALSTFVNDAIDDDDVDDDSEEDDGNKQGQRPDSSLAPSEKREIRALAIEARFKELPTLLLLLGGDYKQAAALADLMSSIETELSRNAGVMPVSPFQMSPNTAQTKQFIALNLAIYYMARGMPGEAANQWGILSRDGGAFSFQAEYGIAMCYRAMGRAKSERQHLASATEAIRKIRLGLPTRTLAEAVAEQRQLLMEEYLGNLYREGLPSVMLRAILEYRQSSVVPAEVFRNPTRGSLYALGALSDLYDAESSGALELPDATVSDDYSFHADMDEETRPQLTDHGQVDSDEPDQPDLNDLGLDAINSMIDSIADEKVTSSKGSAWSGKPSNPLVRDGEVLVFYFVGTHGLYIVTRDHRGLTRMYQRAVDYPELEGLCRRLSEGLANRVSVDRAATTLFKLLLEDIPEVRDAERLSILADGPLQLIPFQALRRDSHGPYVGEKTAVAYIYGSYGKRGEIGTTGKARKIIFIGDPKGDLAGSETEETAIAHAMGEENVTSLIGSADTVHNINLSLSKADIVHFATHATRSSKQPNFSFLQLANGGRLYSYDLGGLTFSGKQVFLGACDTLSAEPELGDDIYGVASAFIGSGARSVIATLWSVEDGPSALFESSYYQMLESGLEEPEALRATYAKFIRGEFGADLKNPAAWAGFNVLSRLEIEIKSETWSTPPRKAPRARSVR